MFAKYDFEIKYRIDKTNFVDKSSRRFDYKNDESENTCLFIFQNKLKNVAIVALCITSITIRNFVAKKTIFENVENVSFKIKKVIDVDEKKFSKNEKKKKLLLTRTRNNFDAMKFERFVKTRINIKFFQKF